MIVLEKIKAEESDEKIIYYYPETKVKITEWKKGSQYLFYDMSTFYKKFFMKYDEFYIDAIISGYFHKIKIEDVFTEDEAKAVRLTLHYLYKKSPIMSQYKFRNICKKYNVSSREFRNRLVRLKMFSPMSLEMDEKICLKDEHRLVFEFDKNQLDILEDVGL
jgi:hypothetical protein